MARERIPGGEILQAAYGVLDKYKMNRSFFIKTEQTDCETVAVPLEAVDQMASVVKQAGIEEETASENETESDEDSLEDEPTTVRV